MFRSIIAGAVCLGVAALAAPSLTRAGVNLKNGNFYITYTDIIAPGGGPDLEVIRTYNSRSPEVGLFGFGWGSDFETSLDAHSDGRVVVREHGAGATTSFEPVDFDKQDYDAAVAATTEGLKAAGFFANEADQRAFQARNADNQELWSMRDRKFRSTLGVRSIGDLVPEGRILASTERGVQMLVRQGDTIIRRDADGAIDRFDLSGRLIGVVSRNGYAIRLVRDANGRIRRIESTSDQVLFFSYYENGLVRQIRSNDVSVASYFYQGRNLTRSIDVEGNEYRYEYDLNHNMTAVRYTDGTSLKIEYTPQSWFVSRVTGRSGETTEYKYVLDYTEHEPITGHKTASGDESTPRMSLSGDEIRDSYGTIVTRTTRRGQVTVNEYHYEISTTKSGRRFTSAIRTIVNGVRSDTHYNANTLPIRIDRNGRWTTFRYTKEGLLTEKLSNNNEFVKLEYHPILKKIVRVEKPTGVTNFEYDAAGNLTTAVNRASTVNLKYDRAGRIIEMRSTKYTVESVHPNKSVLTFVYNAIGKPEVIRMLNVGEISVSYDRYGEIKRVESEEGHEMALKVTQAFQELLAVVKPAGVNLSL